MGEYIIVNTSTKQAQKLLNQWKHIYHLDIKSIEFYPEKGTVFMLIFRKELKSQSTEKRFKLPKTDDKKMHLACGMWTKKSY